MKKFLSLFVALAMVLSLFAGVGARSAKAAAITLTVTVAGTAQVGAVLTATPAGNSVAPTYAWQSNTGTAGAYVAITGATAATYTPVFADVGFTIEVVATPATPDTGAAATSAATAAVIKAVGAITSTTIANAAVNPSVVVTLANDIFTSPAISEILTSWAFVDTASGLVPAAITRTSTTTATIDFTGTALAAGTVTIQALTAALATTTNSNTLTLTVPAPTLTVISTAAITGVTAPATGVAPVTAPTAQAQYSAAVVWAPAVATGAKFAASTAYTATITLTPATGYTLNGVAENFFTVAGATTDTNPINSGVVTAVFPATGTTAATSTAPLGAATVTAAKVGATAKLTLAYAPGAATGEPITGLRIYRNQTGLTPILATGDADYSATLNPIVYPIVTVAAGTVTYTDTTTAVNQGYYYWVLPINTIGAGSISASSFVLVGAAATGDLVSIAISSIPTVASIEAGKTAQFTAIGTYTVGTADITSSVSWNVTGGSSFSSVTDGLLTAGSTLGTGYVNATLDGVLSPYTAVNVTVAVRALQYITITPNPVTLTGAQQFVATANYNTAPLTEVITDSVVWAVSPSTLGAWSTTTAGLLTAAATTTVVGGYVTAKLGDITGYATVTNTTTAATTLTIKTLGGLTSPAYVEEGKTIKLVAVDQTGAIVTPAWTSGSIAVATVGATTGLVLAVTDTGVSVITATLSGVTSTFVVVTIPVQTITSLAVTLVPATLKVAGKQQFGAIAKNAAYSALDYTTQAAWTDDLPVASVGATTGLLTFSAAETGHVYAFAGGFTATGTVTIDAAGVVTTPVVVPAPIIRVIVLTVGTDIVTVDGKATSVDAAPEIINGRTFVPIRFIAETFGSTVTWLPETRGITIVLGTTTIGLQIGNATAVINGTIIALEAAPYIKNSRTMVPLRVISESFGGDVAWDPALRTITINYVLPVVPAV